MTAPRIVVISQDCPSGSSSRKRPSCEPNSRSMLSCGLKAAMNEKNPARPAATVKTAAPTDAMFRAVSKVRSPARRPNKASTSGPSMSAPARFITSFASGVPHSTTGPGSCSSGGFAPPPASSAQTRATPAAARRMTMPARRYADVERGVSVRELTPPA